MDSKFVKDAKTNAVVNNDVEQIRAAKKRKQERFLEKERQKNLEKEVHQLKNDISEIKDLLTRALNGSNNI
jgi:uncharacterized protein (DUF2252 family)